MEQTEAIVLRGMEVLRWENGHEVPENLTGHIVVFDNPLIVHQTITRREVEKSGKYKEATKCWSEPTGKEAECFFMRAEGGFGSYLKCSGRMIIGKFFETIQDVMDNKPFSSGNTKCFPTGYIPELFTEHEKI